MTKVAPAIHPSWLQELSSEFNADYFTGLKNFLIEEKKQFRIYPPGSKIFAAYNNTPFDDVRVVIIGQDPYHNPGQANGLSFSVNPDVNMPPSLKNIFKELKNDTGDLIRVNGDLSPWAQRGVLLLNTVLTVREKQPGSHKDKGWELFTNATIKKLSDKKEGLVFILWGKFAQGKKVLIDESKHHIIESAHPSPYSANNGFFGSKPFSKTNTYLKSVGKEPVDWQL